MRTSCLGIRVGFGPSLPTLNCVFPCNGLRPHASPAHQSSKGAPSAAGLRAYFALHFPTYYIWALLSRTTSGGSCSGVRWTSPWLTLLATLCLLGFPCPSSLEPVRTKVEVLSEKAGSAPTGYEERTGGIAAAFDIICSLRVALAHPLPCQERLVKIKGFILPKQEARPIVLCRRL